MTLFRWYNFGGGLQRTSNDYLRQDDQTKVSVNVTYATTGSITKRNGYTKLGVVFTTTSTSSSSSTTSTSTSISTSTTSTSISTSTTSTSISTSSSTSTTSTSISTTSTSISTSTTSTSISTSTTITITSTSTTSTSLSTTSTSISTTSTSISTTSISTTSISTSSSTTSTSTSSSTTSTSISTTSTSISTSTTSTSISTSTTSTSTSTTSTSTSSTTISTSTTTTSTSTSTSTTTLGASCTIDQQNTASSSGGLIFGRNVIRKSAASFVPSRDGAICNYQVYLKKVESPSDTVKLSLYSDSSGYPGTLLDTADGEVSGTVMTSSFVAYNFAFTGGYSMVSGTTYWMVIERTGSYDNTNYYQISVSNGNVYTSGFTAYTDVFNVWTANDIQTDYIFKQYSIV